MPGMREGTTTADYRDAVSGVGEFGSLGYEWSDKPHRLVYDLCSEVDSLRALLKQVRENQCGSCRAYDDLGLKAFD